MNLKFQNEADKEIYSRLQAYAAQSQQTETPMMAIFKRDDGTVNLEKMRELPCFSGFAWEKKDE